jgi:hypothetical protein
MFFTWHALPPFCDFSFLIRSQGDVRSSSTSFNVRTLRFAKKNIFYNSKKKGTKRAGSHVSTLSPVSAALIKTI